MKRFTLLAASAAISFAAPLAAQTDYCSSPGELVSEDEAGDAVAPVVGGAPYPVPGHDALAVYFAEPGSDPGKVHVTLRVDAQSLAPNTVYFVNFTTNDGVERFFGYNPAPVPSSPATGDDPQFYYGHIEVGPASNEIVTDGPTDPASAASGGDITWVFEKALLDGFADGEFVDGIVAEVNFVTGPFGIGFYLVVDATPAGVYEFRGNCSGRAGTLHAAGPVTAEALAGLLLLAALGALARRRIAAKVRD